MFGVTICSSCSLWSLDSSLHLYFSHLILCVCLLNFLTCAYAQAGTPKTPFHGGGRGIGTEGVHSPGADVMSTDEGAEERDTVPGSKIQANVRLVSLGPGSKRHKEMCTGTSVEEMCAGTTGGRQLV